jgi:hypothetical protein
MNIQQQIEDIKSQIEQHEKIAANEAFQAKIKSAKLRKLEKMMQKMSDLIAGNE